MAGQMLRVERWQQQLRMYRILSGLEEPLLPSCLG